MAVVNDLLLKEQWYLYQKTRELKEAIQNGEELSRFRLCRKDAAVYTIFMEDSTRTKESFRNAAEFHSMKVNMFDAKTSSFQKNETITDTIKMLCGYSTGQSLFVIRSKVEGVCRWLEESIGEYTQQRGFLQASFINAGDGRHEHPTQEFLDEFSFLEHKGWNIDSIHLALLGDLYHGRTVHSKVDGLKLYARVDVDLIAPPELALPRMYEDRMIAAGFNVRRFASIAEYLEQPKVAQIWYFTRLQLERMGDKILDKSAELRKAVTFQREFLERLPPRTKFFHPLPRDARHPTVPFWLDSTELNGWDQQSQNGYFTRIVLLGMLSGLPECCGELEPGSAPPTRLEPPKSPSLPLLAKSRADMSPLAADFVKEAVLDEGNPLGSHLAHIPTGVVMDRLGEGREVEQIWALLAMLRSVPGLHGFGSMGVYRCEESGRSAGYLSVPGFDVDQLDRLPLKKLAAMAPGSSLSVVKDGRIERKFELSLPPRIYNFPDISCKNLSCISHPGNGQREVSAYFLRMEVSVAEAPAESPAEDERLVRQFSTSPVSWAFSCKYCEQVHSFWQIWDYRYYQSSRSLTEFSGI